MLLWGRLHWEWVLLHHLHHRLAHIAASHQLSKGSTGILKALTAPQAQQHTVNSTNSNSVKSVNPLGPLRRSYTRQTPAAQTAQANIKDTSWHCSSALVAAKGLCELLPEPGAVYCMHEGASVAEPLPVVLARGSAGTELHSSLQRQAVTVFRLQQSVCCLSAPIKQLSLNIQDCLLVC